MGDVLRVSEAIERFGRGAVRNNIERKRWQRPCRGVVVTHNGPLSTREREAAALASASPRVALAGPTALAHDGFEGFVDDRCHVVLPAGARMPSMAGLVVHWSTMLDERDVHPGRRPRRTRPARSLLDLASWTRNPRFARAVIIAGIQQGLVTTRHLRETLTRRGPCRHRALIVESILDAAGGVQSLPERDFDVIWNAIGLPPPTRQQRVRGPNGRYFLDVTSALGFSVEIHGIPHLGIAHWDADLARANEIVIGGERLLAFSSYAVRHEASAVADQLLRMARSLGWTDGGTDHSAFRQLQLRERRKFRSARRNPSALR
jgi:hypothetical protein